MSLNNYGAILDAIQDEIKTKIYMSKKKIEKINLKIEALKEKTEDELNAIENLKIDHKLVLEMIEKIGKAKK